MPLAVLTKTEPFQLPSGFTLPADITSESWAAIDTAFGNAQRYFVELVPTTPQVFATGSEHNIQASEPDLVVNATRLVTSRAAARLDK